MTHRNPKDLAQRKPKIGHQMFIIPASKFWLEYYQGWNVKTVLYHFNFNHSALYFIIHKQKKMKGLQEFIFEFYKLILSVTGQTEYQIVEPCKIILLVKDVYMVLSLRLLDVGTELFKHYFIVLCWLIGAWYSLKGSTIMIQVSWPLISMTLFNFEWLTCVVINVEKRGILDINAFMMTPLLNRRRHLAKRWKPTYWSQCYCDSYLNATHPTSSWSYNQCSKRIR